MLEIDSCGKIILFGEHAVVYGKPAIASPVNSLKTVVRIKKIEEDAAKITVPKNALTTDESLRLEELVELYKKELKINDNFHIWIESQIPMSSGMGSSASLCVSMAKAFYLVRDNKIDIDELSKLSFKGEKIFHGNPSGIDTTTISYVQTLFFKKKKKNEFIKVKKPLNILIADTGIKGNTKKAVGEVRKRVDKNPKIYSKVFDDIEKVSIAAKKAMEEGNIKKLGRLMALNHALLKMLNVSNEKLDALFYSAMNNGAYGAKLSGAGMGGNIIALVNENHIEKIKNELVEIGAVNVYHTVIE